MNTPRRIEPTNPWGLTELEFQIQAGVVEHGTSKDAAAALGLDVRSIDNAMIRIRQKMKVSSNVHQVAKWVSWCIEAKRAPARTAWVCSACRGLGFLTQMPRA